jgi:hypothetical protein
MIKEKKWVGTFPKLCDGCGRSLDKFEYFCDARASHGHWGLFCPSCHRSICGGKLGVGLGQKYDSKTLVKIGG